VTDWDAKLRESRSHYEDVSLHLERAECLCEDGSCPPLALKSVADAVRALRRHVDMVPWRDREQEAA
jgi:hypothetical protein